MGQGLLRSGDALLVAIAAALVLSGCTTQDDGGVPATTPSGDPTAGGTGTSTTGAASGSSTGSSTSSATCGYMASEPCECPWVDGCPVPAMDGDADVALWLEPAPTVGGSVTVKARNDGDVPYVYRTHYAACDLGYWTETGRRFLIPEGTHCDIANTATVAPGATVDLFRWDLDECVRDSWGCGPDQHRDLPAGEYAIRGEFCAAAGEPGPGGSTSSDCGQARSRSGLDFTLA